MRSLFMTLMSICFAITMTFANYPVDGGVDLENSKVEWMGKKVTGKHNGSIAIKEANLEMTDGKLTGGNFVIDMTTITVEDLSGEMKGKLEGHLSSDDFFGVANHPTANLILTSVEAGDDGAYAVTGDLTIKGVTEAVAFDVTMKDKQAMAEITVDRTKYGIKYGSGSFFDNLGDKAINDEFTLSVTLAIAE